MLPIFLSTPSARRATHHPRLRSGGQKISIHALREEGDQNSIALIESGKRFLSTPSARRATLTLYHADVLRLISIHALREEGDAVSCSLVLMPCYFYPRPPRGGRQRVHPNGSRAAHFYPRPPRGGRLEEQVENNSTDVFLSTPSARRATGVPTRRHRSYSHFYPRPPRGGRPAGVQLGFLFIDISIHALREEGDRVRHQFSGLFQISIHALREEGDNRSEAFRRSATRFLSTPSARRATDVRFEQPSHRLISIHALREEGDRKYFRIRSVSTYFYPRPPRGGRPHHAAVLVPES